MTHTPLMRDPAFDTCEAKMRAYAAGLRNGEGQILLRDALTWADVQGGDRAVLDIAAVDTPCFVTWSTDEAIDTEPHLVIGRGSYDRITVLHGAALLWATTAPTTTPLSDSFLARYQRLLDQFTPDVAFELKQLGSVAIRAGSYTASERPSFHLGFDAPATSGSPLL